MMHKGQYEEIKSIIDQVLATQNSGLHLVLSAQPPHTSKGMFQTFPRD